MLRTNEKKNDKEFDGFLALFPEIRFITTIAL